MIDFILKTIPVILIIGFFLATGGMIRGVYLYLNPPEVHQHQEIYLDGVEDTIDCILEHIRKEQRMDCIMEKYEERK